MELLKEITESSLGLSRHLASRYKVRRAARAVLFNEKEEVALQYSSRLKYHKLPGGGIEEGESVETALRREIKEETGCLIDRFTEMGLVMEYRNRARVLGISFCFMAYTKGARQPLMLTKRERMQGFVVEWMPLDKAIATVRSEERGGYLGRFMRAREILLLETARKRQQLQS